MTDIEQLEPDEVEAEARKQGWKPESEWKGEPPKRGFVSAEDFLTAADNSLPLATKEKKELEERLAETEEKLDKVLQQSGRYKDYMDKALSSERRRAQAAREEAERAIHTLQERRAQAITEGDGEAVVKVEQEIEDVKQSMPPAPPDAEITHWMEDNQWYKDDPDLAAVADGVSIRLRNERPDLDGRGHLDELTKRVKELMPQKFKNPKREEAPPVGNAQRAPQGDGRTFADLPQDAKDAYYEFKEMIESTGKKYPKEQYLKNYEWEEA
jgi:hypothetical protein